MQSTLILLLPNLEAETFACAFKIVKRINASVTLSEIRACANKVVPVATHRLAASTVEQHVANLVAARDVARALKQYSIPFEMLDEQTGAAIPLDYLESRISLHEPFLSPILAPTTVQFLDQISKSDWFAEQGKRADGNVRVVTNYTPDKNLTYICIGIQDSIVGALIQKTNCHYACLVPLFSMLNESLDRFVATKLSVASASTPNFDPDDIRGLILHACLEMQYPETETSFATECCRWILHGKLPIGWDGDFPDGILILT